MTNEEKKQLQTKLKQLKTLTPVDNMAGLSIFVKTFTAGEMFELIDELKQLNEKYGENDPYKRERSLSLELFNEKGEHFFDYHSDDEMALLKEMPFAWQMELFEATQKINEPKVSKKG